MTEHRIFPILIKIEIRFELMSPTLKSLAKKLKDSIMC